MKLNLPYKSLIRALLNPSFLEGTKETGFLEDSFFSWDSVIDLETWLWNFITTQRTTIRTASQGWAPGLRAAAVFFHISFCSHLKKKRELGETTAAPTPKGENSHLNPYSSPKNESLSRGGGQRSAAWNRIPMVHTTKIMIIWWKKKSWQEVKFGREGKGGERQKAVGDLRAAAVTSRKRQRAAPGWPSGHWANVANVVGNTGSICQRIQATKDRTPQAPFFAGSLLTVLDCKAVSLSFVRGRNPTGKEAELPIVLLPSSAAEGDLQQLGKVQA